MTMPPIREAPGGEPVSTSPLVLIALIAVCLGVSAIGGGITASSVATWYPTLHKSSLTPPNWVFAPVWTALYILMAVAAWRVWGQRRRYSLKGPLVCFFTQLLLNLLWTVVFFGMRKLDAAMGVIAVLLLAVAITTAVFCRIDRLAGAIFILYLGWTAFATYLMLVIWQLNPA